MFIFTHAQQSIKLLQTPPPAASAPCIGPLLYDSSKLLNVLFSKQLAAQTSPNIITSYAFHPGLVATDIFRSSVVLAFFAKLYRHPRLPAQEIADLVRDAEFIPNGSYVVKRRVVVPSAAARNVDAGVSFWHAAKNAVRWARRIEGRREQSSIERRV